MHTPDAEGHDLELRPPAVLAVGISGHRDIGVEGRKADAVAAALYSVFRKLSSAFINAAAVDRAFFSHETPTLRALCMAADGADLLGARAAHQCGAEIAVVFPYAADEYKTDFESAAAIGRARRARP